MALWEIDEVGGLIGWYDASDSSTITESGGYVSEWSDKSPSNNDLIQVTASERPLLSASAVNGLDAITFDGVNDYFDAQTPLLGVTHSVFIVCQPTAEAALGVLIGQYTSGVSGRYFWLFNQDDDGTTTSGRMRVFGNGISGGAGAGGSIDGLAFTGSATALFEVVSTTGSENFKLYKDGTLHDSGTITSIQSTNTSIGSERAGSASFPYDGIICEIAIYDRKLTDNEREAVEGKLVHKWGFEAGLPSAHPYKDAAPTIPEGDPYFNDVSLLLHMDGSDGSTTFTDDSSNNYSITPAGNAQIDTAQSKFGGASGLFDGTGDYLPVGAGDFATPTTFTFEAWVRASSLASDPIVVSNKEASSVNGYWYLQIRSNGAVRILSRNTSGTQTSHDSSSGIVSVGTWHHVAVVKDGTTFQAYVDGIQVIDATVVSGTLATTANDTLIVGGFLFTGLTIFWDGWLDDVRYTGVARYTGSFTPPIAALPDSAGTGPTEEPVGLVTESETVFSVPDYPPTIEAAGLVTETESVYPVIQRDVVPLVQESESVFTAAAFYAPRFEGPEDVTANAGTVHTFALTALDDPAGSVTYQWYDQDGVVPFADAATYDRELQPEDDGEGVYVEVTNAIGTTTSRTATMTVNTTDDGVGDIAPITYRLRFGTYREPFYKNGTVILSRPLVEGESLSIERKTPITKDVSFTYLEEPDWNAFEYQIDKYIMICQEIEGHLCECLECVVPVVSIITSVVSGGLTVSPANPTTDISPGDEVTLTASVSAGTPPFDYAWYKDEVLIDDETGARYAFIHDGVSAEYTVVVSNECGEDSGLSVTTDDGAVVVPTNPRECIPYECSALEDMYVDADVYWPMKDCRPLDGAVDATVDQVGDVGFDLVHFGPGSDWQANSVGPYAAIDVSGTDFIDCPGAPVYFNRYNFLGLPGNYYLKSTNITRTTPLVDGIVTHFIFGDITGTGNLIQIDNNGIYNPGNQSVELSVRVQANIRAGGTKVLVIYISAPFTSPATHTVDVSAAISDSDIADGWCITSEIISIAPDFVDGEGPRMGASFNVWINGEAVIDGATFYSNAVNNENGEIIVTTFNGLQFFRQMNITCAGMMFGVSHFDAYLAFRRNYTTYEVPPYC